MLLYILDILSWLQPEATGGGGGNGAPAGGNGGGGGRGLTGPDCLTQVGLLAVMILVFYFLLIRPQRKREREREEMLKNLRKGQVVRTTGGIKGEITAIGDREATLLVADKVKLNVLRSHIAGPDSGEESAQTKSQGKDTQGKDKGGGESEGKDKESE